MLKSLYINNYALIGEASIPFNKGFTVITGETGAGKSILLGALGLLLGNRADFSVLLDETRKCIVEGKFNLENIFLRSFFEDHDLDYEDDTIIRREIIPSGRSRAFVNDTPVNLELLKELAEKLINIHSQNETLKISKSLFQMQVLDSLIDDPILYKEYQKAYIQLVNLSGKLDHLSKEYEASRRDEDYIQFQYQELTAANLSDGEDDALIEREKMLSHAEELKQGIDQVKSLLSDNDPSLITQLNDTRFLLEKMSVYHTGSKELADRVSSICIELEDISQEINQLDTLSDFNPDELENIADRLNVIYKLQQKHHVKDVTELLQIQSAYKEKLNKIEKGDDTIGKLKHQIIKSRETADRLASKIHGKRLIAATSMKKQVIDLLKRLGMKDASFDVSVTKLNALNEYGGNKVSFLFSANAGSKLAEISQVASGGELSRLMLAIKSLVTRGQLLPTVVFDEIDSGVSGEVAGKVGSILRNMASHHQIITITHLPQIAAKSDDHFCVFKKSENGTTATHISLLDKNSRINEIAKLLSDEKVSDAALETARELLKV